MAASAALKSIFGNVIFIAIVLSWAMAQVIKTAIYIFNHRNIKPRDILEIAVWRTGGMPSSHSAVVSALTTSIGFLEGISSNLFMFCIAFALVVLRDAVGVRRAAGMQAKALNNLGRMLAEKTGVEFQAVKEIQGHTPAEVVVGAVLGASVAAAAAMLWA